MKTNLKNLSVFISICAVITLLLATTNFITAPIIEKNQNASANKALLEVMPDGAGFEKVDTSNLTLPKSVKGVHKETSGAGYIVELTVSGFKPDMKIMCGISSDGVVIKAICLSSNETNGAEKTYGENFTNKNAAGVDEVDTVSQSTKTTEAYKNAIKDALNAVVILGGGSVDIRTEEEILADNLSEAFPDGDKKFEKLFLVEDITGFDAIYTAQNGKGYVFVVGEQFIGVKDDGTVITKEVENAAAITDAVAKIKATVLEDIDITKYTDMEATVASAKKTATGNFVIEAKGPGYGIKGGDEYHPASNEYIIVRVSINGEGKIIDCLTVSQAETKGLGDQCADPKFYGQFAGKDETNYTEIDAISGATLTTDGYKIAIERAYAAVKVLKRGA